MNIINASLLAEAGNTARVAKLLEDEPAIGTFLEAIPVRGKTTLLDTVHRWIAAGAQLWKLEREREELEAGELTLPTGKVGLNVLRARGERRGALKHPGDRVEDCQPRPGRQTRINTTWPWPSRWRRSSISCPAPASPS